MMQVAVVGIMAMGMSVVMIGGGIDLSVGMLASFVALFLALGTTRWGLGLVPSLILVIVLAVAFEAAMGLVISRLSVEPFIITLGGMITFRGVALLICNSQEISIEGALEPLKTNLIDGAKGFSGLALQIPVYVVIFIAITNLYLVADEIHKIRTGGVYAVGANKNAAYLAGIGVKNIVFSTYALNGLLVAIAADHASGPCEYGHYNHRAESGDSMSSRQPWSAAWPCRVVKEIYGVPLSVRFLGRHRKRHEYYAAAKRVAVRRKRYDYHRGGFRRRVCCTVLKQRGAQKRRLREAAAKDAEGTPEK